MQASDRFNINSQLEHLQAKYVGTGHADLNRFEWAVNIQRDSYASYVGHYPMLAYFAVAENESIGRERYNFMQDIALLAMQVNSTLLFSCSIPDQALWDATSKTSTSTIYVTLGYILNPLMAVLRGIHLSAFIKSAE
ncbi:hypothetical protein PTKIN_Ptkin13bG0155100 [Pterospermum kingtungense]